MNTKVLAICGSTNVNVHEKTVDGTRWLVHYSPSIIPGTGDKNFDLLLDCSLHSGKFSMYQDYPWYISNIRHSKSRQYLKLEYLFDKLTQEGKPLYTQPRAFFPLSVNSRYPNIREHSAAKRFVVKHDYGARGNDQYLVPGHLLDYFIHSGVSIEKLLEQYPEIKATKCSIGGDLTEGIDINHYTITEMVDVEQEWRLMVVGGKPIYIYKRHRTDDDYPQANLIHPVDINTIQLVDYEQTDTPADWPFKEMTDRLLQHLHIPFGSIDLYTDKYGNCGVFEYSNEFGTLGFEYHHLSHCTYELFDYLNNLLY